MFSFESKVGFKKDFFNKRFNISPLIGLQYLAINNDDYLEKQDDLAIEYKNQFYHQVIAKIGLEFDSKIKTNNYIFSPNFMFSYNRNLLNNSVNDSYNIANARSGNSIINSSLNKISVNSKIVQINKFNVATGLNIFTKNHESVRLKYQLQTAKNFINHSGFVEYKKEF
jgi:outer membrane autotransporter protein